MSKIQKLPVTSNKKAPPSVKDGPYYIPPISPKQEGVLLFQLFTIVLIKRDATIMPTICAIVYMKNRGNEVIPVNHVAKLTKGFK